MDDGILIVNSSKPSTEAADKADRERMRKSPSAPTDQQPSTQSEDAVEKRVRPKGAPASSATNRPAVKADGLSRRGRSRRDPIAEALKARVLEEMAYVEGHLAVAERLDGADAKDQIRLAHRSQRDAQLADSAKFILEVEHLVMQEFANGHEVDPAQIDPYVIPVRTPAEADLFRYASLQWSVPVSAGYGRRSRFLVKDRQNGKLVAIFALGDPVISQSARDQLIGWDKSQRESRLYNVYDAFVLGAVEPYRQLLGGKLVALLTLANETRDFLSRKYAGNTTVIKGIQKDPTPMLITTSSALGRSSVYNRVTFNGRLMFHSVGFTKGYGHFHFSNELFNELRDYVKQKALLDEALTGRDQSNRYGEGPNWRFRVIRNGLEMLGIKDDALKHNIRREVFLAPVASNWDAYLRGETDVIDTYDLPAAEIGRYYRERWAIGRAQRMPEFRLWNKEAGRLSSQLDVRPRQLAFGETPYVAPGEVELGPYRIKVGTGCERVRSQAPDGRVRDGVAYLSLVVGPMTAVTLADIHWENGQHEVRGWEDHGSFSEMSELVGKHRVLVEASHMFANLALAEVRVPALSGDGQLVVRRLPLEGLGTLLGFDLAEGMKQVGDCIVGTREEVLGDESRRRKELCVLFPRSSRLVPPVLWAATRSIAVGRQLTPPLPPARPPSVKHLPPELELPGGDSSATP